MSMQMIAGPHAEVAQWVGRMMSPMVHFSPHARTLTAVVDDEPMMAVVYDNFRQRDLEMSLAALSPRWCRRDVLRAAFAYPFEQLGCRRITSLVPRSNQKSRRLAEGLGLRLEGVVRCAMEGDEDAMVYGMLKEECRWLGYHSTKASSQSAYAASTK
uniref:N-acetyltransferase domain-containing protein n=1 Tax=Magnetococcus massalia (strain MO-1) TaxID=451514 RepID=A0A1S7LHE5_MAGMO|nr:conserved protein of unknown function. Putative Acyl-CoA N-acyltransferase [Candidatus Magnetococcus massalia]